MIALRPVQRIEARQFVLDHHRHHGWVSGFLWLHGLAGKGGELVGIAVVGRPVARALQDGLTMEVTRLCTDGEPCAHIHALQHAVMARTAQRLHPEIFRQDVPASAPKRPLPPQMRVVCSGASLLPDWLLRRLGRPVPGTIRLKPR